MVSTFLVSISGAASALAVACFSKDCDMLGSGICVLLSMILFMLCTVKMGRLSFISGDFTRFLRCSLLVGRTFLISGCPIFMCVLFVWLSRGGN